MVFEIDLAIYGILTTTSNVLKMMSKLQCVLFGCGIPYLRPPKPPRGRIGATIGGA